MPYQECKEGYNSHRKQASHCIGRHYRKTTNLRTQNPILLKIIKTIRGQPHGCPRTSIK